MANRHSRSALTGAGNMGRLAPGGPWHSSSAKPRRTKPAGPRAEEAEPLSSFSSDWGHAGNLPTSLGPSGMPPHRPEGREGTNVTRPNMGGGQRGGGFCRSSMAWPSRSAQAGLWSWIDGQMAARRTRAGQKQKGSLQVGLLASRRGTSTCPCPLPIRIPPMKTRDHGVSWPSLQLRNPEPSRCLPRSYSQRIRLPSAR